ncbi:MAG: hypothetical protein HC835_01510 [Oscillatoriales cyanobacterium RM2_1_1]|nr:hypothetical protein [Oscillatoriales cyanobacterium SM2_3_0]NJO44406.1 hypothetical protein [Oscillatoriales cyanobacterium RM2_1_1]
MKQFLIRLGACLGIISASLFFSPNLSSSSVSVFSLRPPAAIALTQDKILEKLSAVPVFAVTDAQGAPLVRSTGSGQNAVAIFQVFISRRDALGFIEELKKQDPNLGSTVQLATVPLGKVYEIVQQNRDSNRLRVAFVPTQQQVDSARAVLKASGQPEGEFRGVPLFLAKAGDDDRVLTLQQGNDQAIPFFFTREDLQGMLDQFKTQEPELLRSVKIEVIPLESLLEAFRTDDDQFLDKVILIPPRETVEFIQQSQPK